MKDIIKVEMKEGLLYFEYRITAFGFSFIKILNVQKAIDEKYPLWWRFLRSIKKVQ